MPDFTSELNAELTQRRARDLYRELRQVDSPQSTRIEVGGRQYLNFCSNDYLGLANHPALKEEAILAIERHGAGSGASRLICGSLAAHHELEERLAHFKGTQAALAFSSGYAASLGTIAALVGPGDILVVDKLVHASIIDAARLSGARLRVFRHNDLNDLTEILQWADGACASRGTSRARNDSAVTRATPRGRAARCLIVTESVFSMDGDQAPLREIIELKDRFGAWLMLDEAHATGLYGLRRRGLADEFGLGERIEIQMGTLGKAIGASGGYVCGTRVLIDLLINRARSFVFSTAPVPASTAAARAGIELIQSEVGEQLNRQLWKRVDQLSAAIHSSSKSAILPVMAGGEREAVVLSSALSERGIFVPAIRYPTVPRGQARLRVTLTASHTDADVAELLDGLRAAGVFAKQLCST